MKGIFLLGLLVLVFLLSGRANAESSYWKNYFSTEERKAVQKNAEKYTISEIKSKSEKWKGIIRGYNIKNGTISDDDIKKNGIDTDKIKGLGDYVDGKVSNGVTPQDFSADNLTGSYAALNGSQITNINPLNITGGGNLNIGGGKLFVDVTSGNVGIGTIIPGAKLQIGNGALSNSVDAQVLVARDVDDLISGNGHAFSDSSDVTRGGTIGYNSFDARINIGGVNNFDHYAGFQFSPTYESVGTINNIYGLYAGMSVSSGVVDKYFGVYANNPTGAGVINNNYGVFINTLTKGLNNWSIYTGSAASLFGGDVLLHNPSGTAGTGANLYYTSGSTKAYEALISHELVSSSQGNLHFKVRTNSTVGVAGLGELLTLNGGVTGGVVIKGVNALSTASALNITDSNNLSLIKVLNNGYVGIGTTDPKTKLEVDGIIKTKERATATCDADAKGGIYFDSDDNHFYGCNGTIWVQLDN